jgi:hypothetical protein
MAITTPELGIGFLASFAALYIGRPQSLGVVSLRCFCSTSTGQHIQKYRPAAALLFVTDVDEGVACDARPYMKFDRGCDCDCYCYCCYSPSRGSESESPGDGSQPDGSRRCGSPSILAFRFEGQEMACCMEQLPSDMFAWCLHGVAVVSHRDEALNISTTLSSRLT